MQVEKLSFSKDDGMCQMLLSHTELELIFALMARVRLSRDTELSKAALNILDTIMENGDIDQEAVLDKIVIDASIEDDKGETVVSMRLNDAILDISLDQNGQ
jgi:hypothetical protein